MSNGETITHLPAPLIANWSLSFRCNFDCLHCYTRLDRSPELSTAQAVEASGRLAAAGVMFVNFGGGEPLLRSDLDEVARESAALGLKVSMNSNGWLITPGKARQLREGGFASVGLSIDSHRPEVHDEFRNRPGSHARAVEAAEHLRREGLTVTVSSVISRLNHRHLEELAEMARGLGASRLFLHNYKCTGKGLDNRFDLDLAPAEWKDFYLGAMEMTSRGTPVPVSFDDPIMSSLEGYEVAGTVKGSTCGKISLNIRPNGDMTPCGFIPTVLGNVLRDDLLEVWENSPLLYQMRHKTPKGKCVSCPSFADCLGGCTARAFSVSGDYEEPDPHCWRP